MTRFVVVADAGGDAPGATFHVGDEAMLAAVVALIRRIVPGAEVVATSSCPEWTARRHRVRAIKRLSLADTLESDGWRLRRAFGEAKDANAHIQCGSDRDVADAIADADAVVIAGGGNLSALHPGLLHERLAVCALARRSHTPLLVSGQTVGPYLYADDYRRIREALARARLVGARETFTLRMLERMRLPVAPHLQLDDAFSVGDEASDADPWIAVTVHHGARGLDLPAIGAALDACAATTGWPLVHLPHVASPVSSWSDTETASALAAVMRVPLDIREVAPVAETIARTRRAALVVSSRYHPLVFALGGAVPAIGIVQDAYHQVKLAGALAHAGMRQLAVPARREPVDVALDKAVRDRAALVRGLRKRSDRWLEMARDHERRFEAALTVG